MNMVLTGDHCRRSLVEVGRSGAGRRHRHQGSLVAIGSHCSELHARGSAHHATTLVVVGAVGVLVVPLAFGLQRRLLWRVRRRLILSYVFIGLIPVLLVGVFFLLAGVLTLLAASSYLVELSLDDLVDEARIAANGVVAEL